MNAAVPAVWWLFSTWGPENLRKPKAMLLLVNASGGLLRPEGPVEMAEINPSRRVWLGCRGCSGQRVLSFGWGSYGTISAAATSPMVANPQRIELQ